MGLTDRSGFGEIRYVCGCREVFDERRQGWVPVFCGNTLHLCWPCGCHSVGGNSFVCPWHVLLRIILVASVALGFMFFVLSL